MPPFHKSIFFNKFAEYDKEIETKITVKYPIKKIEKINGKYIVLLRISRVKLGVDELNNILCYNS